MSPIHIYLSGATMKSYPLTPSLSGRMTIFISSAADKLSILSEIISTYVAVRPEFNLITDLKSRLGDCHHLRKSIPY